MLGVCGDWYAGLGATVATYSLGRVGQSESRGRGHESQHEWVSMMVMQWPALNPVNLLIPVGRPKVNGG